MSSSTEPTHRWAGRPGDQILTAVMSRRNFFAVGDGLAAADDATGDDLALDTAHRPIAAGTSNELDASGHS